MDIISQGLLGSAVAVSGAKKIEMKQALWIGAFAGVLADADIFIRSANDPLLTLEYHRQFSHALTFIPVGALLAACLTWCFYRFRSVSSLPFSRIYFYSLLGYLLSGSLDACTSYGTQLFWPFSDVRIAWRLVSIIDPLFSGILLLVLIFGTKMQCLNMVRIGLGVCLAYIGISSYQSTIVREIINETALSRGHEPERLIVKPTLGNIVLWRTIYLHESRYYIDVVRSGLDTIVYEGERAIAVDINKDFPELDKDSIQYQDLLRFNYFSNGYLARYSEGGFLIGDIRYSIFPLSALPLWGIQVSPQSPNTHVTYVTNRQSSTEQRQQFFSMLVGKKHKK